MKKVTISLPRIEREDGKARLIADVKCNKWQKELYYEVGEQYYDALCDDNIDAFIIGILPWCMTISDNSEKVVIESEARMSKQLALQLKLMYIPTVAKFTNNFNSIDINVKTYENNKEPGTAVLSGISGGVDSFYTLMRYSQPDCEYPITHGICANVGAYGGYDSDNQNRLYHVAEDVCKAMNLGLIYVKSNIMLEVYKKQMATNVSFVYMSMGLALQNLVHIYYFSSDVDAGKFNFNEINAEEYDIFNVHMFSNGRTLFYSTGSEVTRMEKIDYISNYPITYERIEVCPYSVNGRQCLRCEKCTETMCALDVLGKLDKYSKVYDIDDYKKNYGYHWGYILLAPKTMPNLKEILEGYKKKYGHIKISAYIACVNKWVKRGFTKNNKKRIQMKDVIDRP